MTAAQKARCLDLKNQPILAMEAYSLIDSWSICVQSFFFGFSVYQ